MRRAAALGGPRHERGPFPAKLAAASLNLSTYVALYTYGYRNLYELGPLVDLQASKLRFARGPKG
ncbi:MAG TPA: hypothetical protein VFM88_09815 [Vicinamibacteria bacterium]|nr:hypothetical protein [Vicinamibacteria bacterium]